MTINSHNNIYSITVLNEVYPLSKELKAFLSANMITSQYKKGDFIVKKGEMCDRLHLIRKGLVRGYFDYKKTEVTTWVSVDSELVTSISGYFKNEPSIENVQCLEDTVTESLSFDDMDFALKNFEDMGNLYRILMEYYYTYSEYRAFMGRIPGAKDRYDYFLKITKPEIVQRLPKKYLASLLNIRPETFSRLLLKQEIL